MSSSSSIKRTLPSKTRTSPAELRWVRSNCDQFDHLLFFNCFNSYNKRRAIRRFKVIVEHWIDDPQKKATLLTNYNKWEKSKDSKIFWKQRAETEQSDSASTVLTSDTTETSSLSIATNLTTEMETFFNENVQLPEADNRYFIDDLDVSSLFHNYQKEAYNHAKRTPFSFKSDYHEFLCFSSILLLEDNSSNTNLLTAFGQSNLQKIIKHLKDNDLAANNNDFPFERMIPVLTTVQQVLTKGVTREVGCLQLMNIGINFQGTQKSIVKFIRIMLESFPLTDLEEIVQEDDLKSRYILPLLQSLCDDLDDENLVFFKITNDNNAECKQKMFDISRRRPDGQLWKKINHEKLITIGYMEAKSELKRDNHEACKLDLVRLSIFGKNAIAIYKLKSTLLVQVIGSTFTFYVLQKKNVDVYTMLELDTFTFPMNVNQIPSIFGYLNRIANIVDIFKTYVKSPS